MERGGWLARETTDAFADYVALAADTFGDRVASWSTLTDPLVQTAYGYALGIDAPGLTLLGGAFQATHHQLLAHGRAVQVLPAATRGSVGIVNHHTTVSPAGRSSRRCSRCPVLRRLSQSPIHRSILAGEYPTTILTMPGAAADVIRDGDLQLISAPLDFYGVSYSHPTVIAAVPDNASIPFSLEVPSGARLTDAGWPIHPASLTVGPGRPAPPVSSITSGLRHRCRRGLRRPDRRWRSPPDSDRIAFLDDHLDAVAAAVEQGCDVRGYFHWSLLDSWEWAEGFSRRFGLVRVDQDTLDREPRASFAHYRELIRRARVNAPG